MKVVALLNAAAGGIASSNGVTSARIAEAFAHANLDADVLATDHAQLGAAARRAAASGADVVVIGGGDGTVRTGAAALVGTDKPLGVLPLGTLNHFARDVGIPLDLAQAVETIKAGHVRAVDVGDVNGHIFLNNSSIGLYPAAVTEREELRHRYGGGKWWSMFHACVAVFRRFPLLAITVRVEGKAVALTTPFVFVGNNRYEMNLFSLGTRSSLQRGELCVYLARDGGRLGLLRLALRALLGRLTQDRDFHMFTPPQVEIASRRRLLHVSLDGEVVRMPSPIRYSLRPRALRVLAPPDPA
jgi:YegS/Rv2252/BmrU family lipid kinase